MQVGLVSTCLHGVSFVYTNLNFSLMGTFAISLIMFLAATRNKIGDTIANYLK